MASGDIYKLAIMGKRQGQDMVNILHYVQNGADGPTPGDQLLAVNWLLQRRTNWLAVHGSEYTLERVVATKIGPTSPRPPFESAVVPPPPGTVAGDIESLPTAWVATKRTDVPGRRGRGRIYFSTVPRTWTDQGRLLTPLPAAINTLCTNLTIPISSAVAGDPDMKLALYHKATNTADVVGLVVPRTTLRVQRRREYGVGS